MIASRPVRATARTALVATGAALLLAAAPQVAGAKTFVARPTDRTGDATDGAVDIRKARVAYNRKSGAMSVSVTMKDAIDGQAHDAIVTVLFSDLRDGKCQKATLGVGAVLSLPGGAVGMTLRPNGSSSRQRGGTSTIDGRTVTMRVQNKLFAGRTPGCTWVVLLANDKARDVIDQTKGDDGFA